MAHRVTPAQIRAARAMLDWSMVDLARAAGVSVSTIKRFESGGHAVVQSHKGEALRDALGANGIRFLDDNGSGAGLRHNPSARTDTGPPLQEKVSRESLKGVAYEVDGRRR